MENIEKKSKIRFSERVLSKKQVYILLAIIIVLQILNVTYFFAVRKEGFHSDEMWSYGFANSFYDPFIYEHKDRTIAVGEWRDGSEFGNYITVQPGEQFRIDSVWYNEKDDMHPPLHPALLHIISSFFPNTFSKYFSYLINVIAMAVGQIYLFRCASRLCKSDFLAVLVCLLWGFSGGFINMNVYLRAYSMMIMLGEMLLFYHIRLYNSEGSLKGNLIKIGLIIIAGALSHHYFLILSFAIVACFCFYYLFKKQWKTMFIYAFSMLASVGLSFALFPAAFNHLFTFGPEHERMENAMPFIHGVRYAFSIVQQAITGYRISAYATSWYSYVVAALVLIAAVGAPLCFLFRKEEWFKKFSGKVIDGLKYFGKHFDFMLLFMVITIFFFLSIVAITVNMNNMTEHTDRYVSVVMPWTALVAVLIIKYVLDIIKPLIKNNKYIISVLCCISLVSSNLYCPLRYLMEHYTMGRGGLETTVNENSKYIMLIEDNWLLTVYPYKLMRCDSFISTACRYYETYIDEYKKITPDNDTYVIIDTTSLDAYSKYFGEENDEGNLEKGNITYIFEDNEVLNNVMTEDEIIEAFETEVFPGYKLQFYGSEVIFTRMNHIFKIVPEEDYTDVPINDMIIEAKKKALKEKEMAEENSAAAAE